MRCHLHQWILALVFVKTVLAAVPVFTSPGGETISIPEDTTIGTSIYSITVTDADGDPLTCQIGTGNSQFNLDDPDIKTIASFDYETVQSYTLTVECNDGTNTATASLTVDINDVNDNDPSFSPSIISVTLAENSASGTSVTDVTCSDADGGGSGGCTLVISSGDDSSPKFAISGTTIQTTSNPIDYETLSGQNYMYSLIVTGTDSTISSVTRTATAYVYVVITPVNDHSPTITGTTPSSISIQEGTTIGTSVCTIIGSDDDDGADGEITYSILSGNSGSAFRVDSSAGVIYTANEIDYESVTSYQLVVAATDGGTPQQSATSTVTVTITDVNDNSPSCSPMVYSKTIDEPSSVGTSVQSISCSDGDSNTLTYSIYSGNTGGEFRFESGSPQIIELAKELDYDLGTTSFTLLIEVSDGTYTATTTVGVAVNPVNEYTPSFSPTTLSSTISEDDAVGTIVATYTATDGDTSSTSHGVITYAIVSVSNGGAAAFSIDQNSGAIQLTKPLDYELVPAYNLVISATDGGGSSGTGTVALALTNANDNTPVCSPSSYAISVPEDSAIGYTVLTISGCSDSDGDALTYTLTQNPGTKFSVQGTFLKLSGSLDYETTQNYELQVTVTDTTAPQRSTTVVIGISVSNVNDGAPAFNSALYSVQVSEDTIVGSLVTTVDATDQDGDDITYSFQTSSSEFLLDASNGNVLLKKQLDRETTSNYLLPIEASDGTLTATTTLTITVTDVNEAPVFSTSTYNVDVAENSVVGTSVMRVTATDADSGANGDITYSIVSGSGDSYFTIDSSTGQVSTAAVIDYESNTAFSLVVQAQDGGTPSLSAQCLVQLTVIDMNDNPPQFAVSSFTVSIDEDSPVGTSVTILSAEDADSSSNNNNVFEYSIVSSSVPFIIGITSGEITVSSALDRENTDSYNVVAHAIDKGSPPLTGTCTVTVTLADVNDNYPVVTGTYDTTISESTSINTVVFTIAASDPDIGNNATLTYTLTAGNTNNDFKIDSYSGIIQVSNSLDRERTSIYHMEVTVADNGPSPRSVSVTATVAISDENDNTPIISASTYSFSVDENLPSGTSVGVIVASDLDTGVNAVLVYSIVGYWTGNTNTFTIGSSNGQISTATTLDREQLDTYEIWCRVEDGGTPVLYSDVNVTVTVNDVNDNTPVFNSTLYTGTLTENTNTGTDILTVVATDDDIGTNADIEYSIDTSTTNGSRADLYLQVDSSNGVISVKTVIDRESDPEFVFGVIATDKGVPAMSSTATVSINIQDENDNNPVFDVSFYNTEVAYTERICDRTLTTLTASDPDDGVNALLSYYLIFAVDSYLFQLDSSTGELTGNGALSSVKYIMNALVRDNGNPDLTSASNATIRIDTFSPYNVIISFYLTLNETTYSSLESSFISQLTTLYRDVYPTSTVNRWCVTSSSSLTILHTYIIADNVTDTVTNLSEDKVFLSNSVAQRYVAVDDSGTLSSKITGSSWDVYEIQKVVIYSSGSENSSTESWIETPLGIAITTLCVIAGVALIAIGTVAVVKYCKAKKSVSNSNGKIRASLYDNNGDAPSKKTSSHKKGKSNSMATAEDYPEPMFQKKSAVRNAYINVSHPNIPKSKDGYLIQNRNFDGRALDPATGQVYEYNTKTDGRSWIRTPDGDPIIATYNSEA